MRFLFIAVTFCMLISTSAQAQFGGKLKEIRDKALNKLEEKFDKKVDEEIDKKTDVKLKKKEKEEADENLEESVEEQQVDDAGIEEELVEEEEHFSYNSNPIDVKIRDSYIFNGEVVYEINNSEGGHLLYSYLYNNKGDYSAMVVKPVEGSEGSPVMIHDGGVSITLLNMSGRKIIVAGSSKGSTGDYDVAPNFDASNLTKTGSQKTILGHLSEEYVYKGKDYVINAWVSKTLDIPNMMVEADVSELEGFLMEYDVQNLQDKSENVSVKIISIDKTKQSSFNTSEYDKMGGF